MLPSASDYPSSRLVPPDEGCGLVVRCSSTHQKTVPTFAVKSGSTSNLVCLLRLQERLSLRPTTTRLKTPRGASFSATLKNAPRRRLGGDQPGDSQALAGWLRKAASPARTSWVADQNERGGWRRAWSRARWKGDPGHKAPLLVGTEGVVPKAKAHGEGHRPGSKRIPAAVCRREVFAPFVPVLGLRLTEGGYGKDWCRGFWDRR